MTTYVVRVWVPDRPGALGAVASRIGAVRGDLVGLEGPVPLASVGSPPPAAWLSAFVAGSRTSVRVAAGDCGPDDVAWAALATSELALILGRKGRPFRARERRQLGALARIADHRWVELAQQTSRVTHPSALGR